MSLAESSAVLHRLVEVLDDPAPINPGHARYVSQLIVGALGADPAVWSGSGAVEQLAAILPEDGSGDVSAL